MLPTNDYGMVRITMSALKNWPNQYWSTHYLALNTWTPSDKPKDWAVPVNEVQEVYKNDIDLPLVYAWAIFLLNLFSFTSF